MSGSRLARVRAALLLLVALAAPGAARATGLLSPGPLAKGHERLEGLAKCTQCHAAGKGLAAERCIACHEELKDGLARGRGLHGRLPASERSCDRCHHEHQGADFPLVDWGPAGKDRFDHSRAGYPLRGKHAVACAKCHEPRLIADAKVRALREKSPSRATYLGAPTACTGCHFDDHRGQTSKECQRCHDEQGWKQARLFRHSRTRYPLEGAHARVACARCHPQRTDESTPADAFPRPVKATFLVMKPIPFARCQDCHKDPHKSRFGESCESCHTVRSWKEMAGRGKESAFHLKTRYPLEGAHVAVACKACHGPFGREKARYKDMAFKACSDCHFDAHVGQLVRKGRPTPGCEQCHTVQGWKPVKYEMEEHARARYPLAGAHFLVACAACHPGDEALAQRVPASVRARLAHQERPVKPSLALIERPGFERCETCHKDPHAGQLEPRTQPSACLACHTVASWTGLTFDHQRDSRYALAGKHAKAACAACHPRDERGVVRYRPIERACEACHLDAHAGQLSRGRGRESGACQRCHDAESWKAPLFAHAPPFTSYRLLGKHAKAKCEACHPAVAVAAGVRTARYRPLPAECEGCHADFHKGAFKGFVP